MDLKTKKRTKMHHVITLTFCYFPFALMVNLWVMRAVRMDCQDTIKLAIPLIVETIIFMGITHFFNDMERLEQLLMAISRTCPSTFIPMHEDIKQLSKALYFIRLILFISLLAILPWGGVMPGIIPCLLLSVFIWILVILQDTYYLILYYRMFGKNKDSG